MFSPGFGRVPPPLGCDCTGLVASGSSELEATLPVHSVRSLRRSLALVRADDSLHLVSSLSAEHFGLWPYGLAIAALPLVSRPWTCLCWSHLLSLSSGGSVRGSTAPVGWLRGVSPCFAYCPPSSVLKRSSFGFSASSFALSLRDGVTLPGRVCLSPRSDRRLFLHLPGVWLESSRWGHPVGSGFVPDLDRNEDFLAHLPWWLVSCLRDGVTHFGSGGAFLRPRSERRLLPFIYP